MFWASWPEFNQIAYLVDDPHFIIRIVSCPHCEQRYVAITTEFIDWQDGDDEIYRSILPLTVQESVQLLSQGENVDVRLIESLGRARRRLNTDRGKGEKTSVYWVRGNLRIVPGG